MSKVSDALYAVVNVLGRPVLDAVYSGQPITEARDAWVALLLIAHHWRDSPDLPAYLKALFEWPPEAEEEVRRDEGGRVVIGLCDRRDPWVTTSAAGRPKTSMLRNRTEYWPSEGRLSSIASSSLREQ